MSGLKHNNCKFLKCLVSTAPQFKEYNPDVGPFLVNTGCDGSFCVGSLHTSREMRMVLPNAYVRGVVQVTAFDKAVMDAIYTIWTERKNPEDVQCELSFHDIYKKMSGGRITAFNEKTKMKVKSSVYKLMLTTCIVNITSDLTAAVEKMKLTSWVKKGCKGVVIEGTLIPAEFITVKNTNDTFSGGIRILKCPILYEYADAIDQIIWIEEEWLRVPYYFSDKTIAVRDYLISYIRGIEHKRSDRSNWVGYKTIFENAGLEWSEKKGTQCKNRKFVNDILKYYIDAKIIKSFEISEDNCRVHIVPVSKKKKR